jgi:Uma2 family endonuclease
LQRLKMGYEEFLAWSTEDTHAEWVGGEVTVFMPPKLAHQAELQFLNHLISLFVDLFDLGVVLTAPFEMCLPDQKSSREPDLLFVAKEHLDRLDDDRLTGPADFVLEDLSDSTERIDRRDKFAEYAAAGVPEYWMTDARPGRQPVDPYRLAGRVHEPIQPDGQGRYHSLVLPGFWLDPAWLRQRPLPRPLTVLALIAPRTLRQAVEQATAPGE